MREAVERLRKVEGVEAVLTDPEDLYVYSTENPFSLRLLRKPEVILKVKPEALERVVKAVAELGLSPSMRGESWLSKAKVAVIDHFTTPDLEQLDKNAKIIEIKLASLKEEVLAKILKARIGTSRRLSLALEAIVKSKVPKECYSCKVCTGYCTVAPFFNHIETWSSKGRLLLIHGYEAGELKPSPKLAEVVYSCTLCGSCFMSCLRGSLPALKTDKAIMVARRDLAKEGLAPQPFKAIAQSISTFSNPYSLASDVRWSWLEEVEPKPKVSDRAEVLYWVGCTTCIRLPEVAKAIVEVLKLAKIDFAILKEEGCCGSPLFIGGMWDEATKIAFKVIEAIKNGGYKTLVTGCAGCYRTFSTHYPELLSLNMPCEVLHFSQLLERMVKEGGIVFGKKDLKVAYHDPCELGRHSGVYGPPRRVMKSIEGLKLVEPPFTKEKARCCGGGGGLWAYKSYVSMAASELRLTRDIVPLDVDKLVTACPACHMNFRYTTIDRSIDIEVVDLAELVLDVLKF